MLEVSKKFFSVLARTSSEHIKTTLIPRKDEASEVLINRLLDLEGVRILDGASTEKGRFIAELTITAYEIYGLYETLLDAEVYVRRFPYYGTRITKTRHMQYGIVNFLNNVYILKARVKKLLVFLEDFYAVDQNRKIVRQITQPLFTYNSRFFEDLVDIRGSHVHNESFTGTDLDRLGVIESLVLDENLDDKLMQLWIGYFDTQYERIRKERTHSIQFSNKKIQQMLENLFSKIYPVVIDENDNLIIPNQCTYR